MDRRPFRSARAALAALAFALLGANASLHAATPVPAESSLPANATDSPLPPLLIEDERPLPGGSLAELGTADPARSPLVIDSVDARAIADHGIRSLSQLIRDFPAVRDSYDTFGYIETLQVRGFALDENLNTRRDGLATNAHIPVALENKERVEILEGISGMLTGTSAPGGMVNYVLKQPPAHDLALVEAALSERGSVLSRVDLGGHAGGAERIGYRVNAVLEERHPEVDHAWSRREMGSVFLDGHLGETTLVQVEGEWQRVRSISVPGYALVDARGIGTGTQVPAPIDPRINLNAQPWTQPFDSRETSASARLLQGLAGGWDLALRLGMQTSTTDDRIAFPDGCSAGTNYVYNGLCAGNLVDIYQYVSDGERRDTTDADARLHGHASAAGLDHELTLGLRSTQRLFRAPPLQVYNYVGTESVFAPLPFPANAAPSTPNAPSDLHEHELYAYDVARRGRASAWLGLRAAQVSQHSQLSDGTQATELSQRLLTPWAGAGWEPAQDVFAWASAGTGVEIANAPNHPLTVRTSGATLPLANPGQALPAMRSHQLELGLRRSGPATATRWQAVLFRIDRPYADAVPLADGTALFEAGARWQRNQGTELSIDSRVAPQIDLHLRGAWIDARTTRGPDPSWVGHRAVNTAGPSASATVDWSPRSQPGTTWSNALRFTGPVAALPDGSAWLAPSWQWDSFARRSFDRGPWHFTVRLGVENVTNHRYWREAPIAPWGSIYLFPAAARTARLSVEIGH